MDSNKTIHFILPNGENRSINKNDDVYYRNIAKGRKYNKYNRTQFINSWRICCTVWYVVKKSH